MMRALEPETMDLVYRMIAARLPDARWDRVEIRPAMDVAGVEM